MRRLPLLPTLLVGLAVAIMIALGFWQLQRLGEKEAFIARVAANPVRPPVAFPDRPDEALLFRRSTITCRPPLALTRAGAGAAGYRVIAACADGRRVQLGTTRDPMTLPTWEGGSVTGWIGHAPDTSPLIASLFSPRVPALMLVADRPRAGLAANRPPDPATILNSHLAYAGQWFFFAAIAAIIYALALRRRVRPQAPGGATIH